MVSQHRFGLLVLGVGIILVAAPVGVFEADLGAPTSEFEAVELSYENGSFEYPATMATTVAIENIACVGESRACKLERRVHEAGRVPVADGGARMGYYEFAYLDDSFYLTDAITANGTTYLTHEPVSADAAMSGSATSFGIAPRAYRAAIDGGRGTTSKRLDERALVSRTTDRGIERYYYVYATSTPPAGEHGPDLRDRLLAYGLSIAAFASGVACIARGQRIRVRSRLRR